MLMAAPLWSRGFRPFFIGAAAFAILAMAAWLLVYRGLWAPQLDGLTLFQWHAHEMVYGYAMAVIAGFLLTAAWNWTGRPTADGAGLAVLFAFWLAARAAMLAGSGLLAWAAAADLLFILGLAIAVGRPVLAVRQKRQAPVLALLALLTLGNTLFYLGVAGHVADGARIGVYLGLYLVLGMVLFMGRRVIPFFTSRGVGYEVEMKNDRWNDIASSVLFPLYLLSEVFQPGHAAGAALAGLLFVLNSFRVHGWYTLGIWHKPLLWSLFGAFVMINLGFLMHALTLVTAIAPYLHLHAFAVGGIGIVTVSMMARVTLGHTGRNVHEAPPVTLALLALMALTTVLRILMPMTGIGSYANWVTAAGISWIAGFGLFFLVFAPMLMRERADAANPTE
jgi:uncharacterized protein involved in response to NO